MYLFRTCNYGISKFAFLMFAELIVGYTGSQYCPYVCILNCEKYSNVHKAGQWPADK